MLVRDVLSIVEIRTKIVSVSTFLLAAAWTAHEKGGLPPLLLILLFLAALAVDMGTTGWNTFFDFRRGVDSIETNRETDKVLVHGTATSSDAFWVSFFCYLVAIVTGAVIAVMVGWWVAVAGAASMLVGFVYTGGPIPISRTPLGEAFAGFSLGSGFFLIAAGILGSGCGAQVFVASLPSTLLIAAILAVNNACDIVGDKAAGRKTLAILLGTRAAPAVALVFVVAGYALSFVLSILGVYSPYGWPLFLAGLAVSLVAWRNMAKRGFSHASKGPNMGGISRIFLVFTLSQVVSYASFFLI